jgi:tetratricopeptide (TPR) repeat protein
MSGLLQTRALAHIVAGFSLLLPLLAQVPQNASRLQGSVRDATGHPLAAATVLLKTFEEGRTRTARTDSNGRYNFSPLNAGTYRLRAQMPGYGEASIDHCVIGPNETKQVDFALPLESASVPKSTSSQAPEFFDQPEFTVAGVTDTANLGGHGSSANVRTAESLAKEVRSLDTDSSNANSEVRSLSVATEEESAVRAAVEREPESFEANQRLGRLLVTEGKAAEALPYLERASQLRPADYGSSYELARGYADAGRYELARKTAQGLIEVQGNMAAKGTDSDKAELHHLLGDADEALGNSLEAVGEYQHAADLSRTEPHVFDWGTELLLHHALEPAAQVFTAGNRLFPRSARMLVGLGVTDYALRSYDEAAQRLCEASDLSPEDPTTYLILAKIQAGGNATSEAIGKRLERFVKIQPESALANYYYAVNLWNAGKRSGNVENSALVESLLEKAVHLDTKLGAAYLQLGIVDADRQDFPQAIGAYLKAIAATPDLEEAHYRLAQAYNRTGEKLKAREQIQLYEQISRKTDEEAARERVEIQQFVYTLRDHAPVAHP